MKPITKLLIIISLAWLITTSLLVYVIRMDKEKKQTIQNMFNTFLTELGEIDVVTAKLGNEVATIRTQLVTKDMMNAVQRQNERLIKDMNLSLNKRIDDITLVNTVTTYNIKDTLLTITDTSYISEFVDYPWVDFRSEVIPSLDYSNTHFSTFDSLGVVGSWSFDKEYRWPKRLWKPLVGTTTITNFNPYSEITYARRYKLEKER